MSHWQDELKWHTEDIAATNDEMVAAPGVGFQIVVYYLFASSADTEVLFLNSDGTNTAIGPRIYFNDSIADCGSHWFGRYVLPENEALDGNVTGANNVRVSAGYKIEPVGRA